MQRERSALDSFPEPIDLNQGSLPNNTSMDHHSGTWGNIRSPVENRFPNYMLVSTDGSVSCPTPSNDSAPTFSCWDRGESSSSANNMQTGEDSKTSLGWSSSFNGPDSRSESWSFEPSNISHASNQVTARLPLGLQNYSSNRTSLSIRDPAAGPPPLTAFYATSSNIGTSSGSSTFLEANDVSGSSFSTWGSSCKRKALESTSSGQFYPGGSSSSNQPNEKATIHHAGPGFYSPPGNLTISPGPLNLSPPNQNSEPLNARSRAGPGFFPSSSLPGIAETSSRNFGMRSNHGPAAFDTSRSTSVRNFGVFPGGPPQPISSTDSSELRSAMTLPMSPNSTNQPHLMPVNETRGMHSYSWNGSFGSRGGAGSSFMVPGERGSGESNMRSARRNNLEYPNPMTVSAPETTRNVLQEQIDWSFAPGTSASSRNHSSGSRVGPTSGGRSSSSSWMSHQSQMSQRVAEGAGWIPFPRVESESGNRRSHFGLLPSASSSSSSSSSDAAANRRSHSDQRSSALLMDMPGDDIPGWRALAAVEGRHRLIRQVLNAMRRGVHLQAEDYMLIDPFINGFAELNDRHRDMRLDVDNMSYEELLALEERIGNVNTGLTEDKIRSSMKQRKYDDEMGSNPNLEPCCVCQEDYISGDDVGILDCGHEFHTNCIKQWLTLKNICPICKTTALET